MSALLAASRPTRRDMARHPLRILAAVLLIALPVLALSWMATSGYAEENAASRDPDRTRVTWHGGTCVQSIDGTNGDCTPADPTEDRPIQTILEENLPEGFTAGFHGHTWGVATHGQYRSEFPVQQRPGGRVPPPGEVWLTTTTAKELHADTGDTITFTPQDSGDPVELTVAGTMPGYTGLVAEPALVDPATARPDSYPGGTWSITGPGDFTWDDVLALNAVGFTVVSQDVIDNPPPVDAIDGQVQRNRLEYLTSDLDSLVVALAGALTIGLLAVLVISPVFTIATSRMARIFALMSAQGATPWHIRLAVLTYGFVAGLLGASLGVALGVGAAAVSWFLRYPGWALTVPWSALLLIWAVAVAGSTVASLLPAWVASRASISAGVQGASPDRLLGWRPWMLIGPVGLVLLTGIMLVLWVFAEPATRYFWSTLPALALVLLLAASAPALVWGLGRLGRGAPLPLRLALRDAGRQSMRSVPALAAIMTVLAIAVGIYADQSASQSRDRALHDSVYQGQSVLLTPGFADGTVPDPAAVDDVVAAVQAETGTSERIDLRGVRYPLESSYYDIDYGTGIRAWDRRDHVSGVLERTPVSLLEASPEILDLLRIDDTDRARALTALHSPGILVPVGTEQTELPVREVVWDATGEEVIVLSETVLPTVPVLPELAPVSLVTPAGLAEAGAPVDYVGTVLVPEEQLTWGQQQDLRRHVVEEATVGLSVQVSPYQWVADWWPAAFAGILGTGVVVVVTLVLALSWQGSRRQFALLDAVGAPPFLPSRVSGAFAAVLALTGSTVGVFFGYLAALLLTSRTRTLESGFVLETGTVGHLVPDWRILVILLVVTPFVAWVIGRLVHRRVGEPEYRET